ncbi:MAG TPA: hypothetical protein VJH94_05280 [Candidatus Paceibacterota bacterium]
MLLLFTVVARQANNEDILITSLVVEGNALIPTEAIRERANEALSGYYFLLFPKRNTFLFREKTLVSSLKDSFPAIGSLELQKISLSGLKIVVHERQPFAIWCPSGSQGGDSRSTDCYFLDREGMLFTEAPHFSSGVYLRFESAATDSSVLGNFVMPPERFSEFLFFLKSFKPLGLDVSQIVIEKGAGNIEDYTLVLTKGTKLYINALQSLEATLQNVSTFFTDPEIAMKKEAFLERVAYVDFRFWNKVYYRYR